MKIAFLSVFYPYRGGIAQFNAAVYRALGKIQNVEIKAFNFSRLYPKLLFPGKDQYVTANDTAFHMPSERILDGMNPFNWNSAANKIIDFKPDFLLTDFWLPFFSPSLGKVAKKLRKNNTPVISILSNVVPHEKRMFDIALTKYFLKNNDGFIILTESVKNDLLKLKPDAKYLVHPHPNYEHFGEPLSKEEARKFLNLPLNKKVILFFGLIRYYKGLDLLLEAMGKLNNDYYLLIAGEVYGKPDLYDEIIGKNNLSDKVKFVNKYLSDDEVAPYFSAADVCVLPYRSATQSGIIGVSYHFGLPVISTDVGGLKEVIEPFRTGIVLDKADIDLLKVSLENYFVNNLAVDFKRNIASFSERYNWDTLANCIIDLYKQIS